MLNEREWFARVLEESLTVEVARILPSEWAETRRYLADAQGPMPGYYSFDVTPYWREPLDCLSPASPVRRVTVAKGAQVGATVGILENFVGYAIDHVRTAPCMLVTADAELAKMRLENYILPMIHESGMDKLVRSSDEGNKRKTGRTAKKIEWSGGGSLLPFGAVNANKLRSFSIRFLLEDEVDGWPVRVGRDGDPQQLAEERTTGFMFSRKILELSTPLLEGSSRIHRSFLAGDQRRYFVPCPRCGHMQTLVWRGKNEQTGEVWGVTWELNDDSQVVAGSVRYVCERCFGTITNEEKQAMLKAGEWRPTAVARDPFHRSYHLSGLYAPVGLRSWEECARLWFKAYDPVRGATRDVEQLQVFVNNVQGEPFRAMGARVRFEAVSAHRRDYRMGEVPNDHAIEHCGGRIQLLTVAVDAHKDFFAVAVLGWTANLSCYLIEYHRWDGKPEEDSEDPATWGRFHELVQSRVFTASDGWRYQPALVLVDSGYESEMVYRVVARYAAVVFPVKGAPAPSKAARYSEFSPMHTMTGTPGFRVTVDHYKERWHHALRRQWSPPSRQSSWTFNAPSNLSDRALQELTREERKEKKDAATGKQLGWQWVRSGRNELWDCLVYGTAALEILGLNLCQLAEGDDAPLSWEAVWRMVEAQPELVRSAPPP